MLEANFFRIAKFLSLKIDESIKSVEFDRLKVDLQIFISLN